MGKGVLKIFLIVLGITLFVLAMAEISTLLPFSFMWVLWLLLGIFGVLGAFYIIPTDETGEE